MRRLPLRLGCRASCPDSRSERSAATERIVAILALATLTAFVTAWHWFQNGRSVGRTSNSLWGAFTAVAVSTMMPAPGTSSSGRDRLEDQRYTIDAVPQTGRLGPVVEYMAEMAAASSAVDGGPDHAQRGISFRDDGLLNRSPEARPARAALEFGRGREGVESAARTCKRAAPLLMQERARKRALGGLMAQHRVLIRGEQLAPFRVGASHFELLRVRRMAPAAGHLPASATPAAVAVRNRRLVIMVSLAEGSPL